MAAMTLDHLSGGRFILGIGASGPQVVEGWYGQPYPRPLERTKEYVQIMRKIFAREEPVEFAGQALPDAASGRHGARQGAEVHGPPAPQRHPDLPRGRGPEERRAGGGDRRRLAADVLLAEERTSSTATRWRRASRGPARATSPRTSRSPRSCRSSPATTSRPPRTSCARCSRCTSAGWARAARTSTTT